MNSIAVFNRRSLLELNLEVLRSLYKKKPSDAKASEGEGGLDAPYRCYQF
jgi:hypothetical protein